MAKGDIQGLRAFQKILDRLPTEVAAQVEQTIFEQADEVRALAYRMAPVRSGNMREHLEVVMGKDGLAAQVGFVTAGARRAAYYAGWIEFGTKRIKANPFLHPATTARRADFHPAIREAVRRALAAVKG